MRKALVINLNARDHSFNDQRWAVEEADHETLAIITEGDGYTVWDSGIPMQEARDWMVAAIQGIVDLHNQQIGS